MKIIFTISFLIFITLINATIINIPADQSTIQEGINIAVDGDTVLVQSGTYVENINYNGKLITVASLFLTTQDTSYISQTIIDGNYDDIVVRFESEEDSTSIITGFKIINGYSFNTGGGIYCSNSGPKIKNLLIVNNFAANFGGGICCRDGSEPILENIVLVNNTAGSGGGIYCNSSSPKVINSIVTGNSAERGGGIYCSGSTFHWLTAENVAITYNSAEINGGGIYITLYSNPIFTDVTISNNSAEDSGGGIYCGNGSNPSITGMIISENTSDMNGGGIYIINSDPEIEQSIIEGNSANWGASIYCYDNSNAILNNVVIFNNTALIEGGGILNDSNLNITNSTITMNNAPIGAGLFCSGNSNSNILNSILWNNQSQGIYVSGGSILINHYSNGIGSGGSFGNIDEDPLFVGTGDHPFMLQDISPCVNAGIPDTTGLNLPEYDLAGNPRVYGGRIDMGAYENQNIVVSLDEDLIPLVTKLNQNYPNPFNPTTTISFSLQNNSIVELSIYNIKGQKIKSLVKETFERGTHSVVWNSTNQYNQLVSSGIYLYKLNVEGKTEAVKKCLLLK